MKKYLALLIISLSSILASCNLDSNTAAEEILEAFTKYREDRNLDVLHQTIPQVNEELLLAIYQTTDNELGIVEFDNDDNLTKEQELKEPINVLSLKGHYGDYIVAQHSNEMLSDVEKVELLTADQELIESFELNSNETLSVFTVEDPSTDNFILKFLNEDNDVLELVDFHVE